MSESESESERQRARNGTSESEREFSRERATIHTSESKRAKLFRTARFSPLSGLSEKNERDLPTSERENDWCVAHGSIQYDVTSTLRIAEQNTVVTVHHSHQTMHQTLSGSDMNGQNKYHLGY